MCFSFFPKLPVVLVVLVVAAVAVVVVVVVTRHLRFVSFIYIVRLFPSHVLMWLKIASDRHQTSLVAQNVSPLLYFFRSCG